MQYLFLSVPEYYFFSMYNIIVMFLHIFLFKSENVWLNNKQDHKSDKMFNASCGYLTVFESSD